MIAVRRNLIDELVPTDDTCELKAVKITCQHNPVTAASIYRPTNNDTEYAAHLATAMENLAKKHTKGVIWIGGDSNLPDINWSTNSTTGCNYKREINAVVLQAADNCGLDQVLDFPFPTRDTNLLDVFLTNRPSLIQECYPLPGISDHEMVYVDSDVSARYRRPIQRKIWLWSKADIPVSKQSSLQFSEDFIDRHSI